MTRGQWRAVQEHEVSTRPARLLLTAPGMTIPEREALAQRLGKAETELQRAQRDADGSPRARMRLARARTEYREAEHLTLRVLGARQALDLVEQLSTASHQAACAMAAPASSRRAAASQ
ncbi:hypothetical protein [Corallococcus exiguus]|uniref:hypothetical protein n=1 Tax=Corallococcus exiguus TaxID=83462 RepID=UPI0014715260|nr:hypothetical protein [Corallococcus exiguus]NNB89921.1 hypothetical protein [Corallococcus exiguus]